MDRLKIIANKRKTLINLQNNIYVEREHNAFGMIYVQDGYSVIF